MNQRIINYSVIALAYAAVLFPLWIWFRNLGSLGTVSSVTFLFPAFGLIAFSVLWLHAISGVFEPWLRKHFDFDRFVRYTSLIVLISIILHPLLLLFRFNLNLKAILSNYEADDIMLGIVGWLLLITYDIGKPLKRYDFFSRNWNNILLISTIGFLLIFFHSLSLGSDLQTGVLRILWIFYGVTAILATIYTYGIKRLFMNSQIAMGTPTDIAEE